MDGKARHTRNETLHRAGLSKPQGVCPPRPQLAQDGYALVTFSLAGVSRLYLKDAFGIESYLVSVLSIIGMDR